MKIVVLLSKIFHSLPLWNEKENQFGLTKFIRNIFCDVVVFSVCATNCWSSERRKSWTKKFSPLSTTPGTFPRFWTFLQKVIINDRWKSCQTKNLWLFCKNKCLFIWKHSKNCTEILEKKVNSNLWNFFPLAEAVDFVLSSHWSIHFTTVQCETRFLSSNDSLISLRTTSKSSWIAADLADPENSSAVIPSAPPF